MSDENCDGKSENLNIAKRLFEVYKIDRINTSVYHSQAKMISLGVVMMPSFILFRSTALAIPEPGLDISLAYDPTDTRPAINPFKLMCKRDVLLSVDLSLELWSIVDWEGEINDRESLLLAGM
jgi:hypothetical protein